MERERTVRFQVSFKSVCSLVFIQLDCIALLTNYVQYISSMNLIFINVGTANFKGDCQRTLLRLVHNNVRPEFPELSLRIHEFPYTECTNWVFVDSLKIYTTMSKINFIFIYSSGLEILSTFNIYHPVYGCLLHVLFIVHCCSLKSVHYGHLWPDKRHLAEKKVSWIIKKIF